ncbi:MHYT domain-containing protein [Dactylosporangium sucinum]|uniref:MHYT domain-containing protein n=1 Tax=Dactylosporangium sucinum TaxID=1424081 RepID=A0A917U5U4_9ACTN|nr:MHYT domain-containing protein [Dactylosporangium sucinum]GGM60196.1 hypothetical protein GCM10007977_072140 [Dactylosporangium sucinum]
MIEHFAYGWLTPALALALAFLGCLLGTYLAGRSRGYSGHHRARWLTLAALAFGACGTWLPHFMALLGADVPGTVVRYDVTVTALGPGLAVVVHCLGLYLVGFGRPSAWKILPAGVLTGLGLTAVHGSGPLAMRIAGTVGYDLRQLLAAAVAAIVAATVTLWCVTVVRGTAAMLCAAGIMAIGVCSTHYTVMASVRAVVAPVPGEIPGQSLFTLLVPVCVVAGVLLSGLAYSTVGLAVRQDTAREEALLRRARDMYSVATLTRAAAARQLEQRQRDRGDAAVPSHR